MPQSFLGPFSPVKRAHGEKSCQTLQRDVRTFSLGLLRGPSSWYTVVSPFYQKSSQYKFGCLSPSDWSVSEDNCFCRVFYPSGRLHWEKRDCFVSYQNPTPIFSANHLAWPISLWVMSDPLHQAAFWRNENSASSLGERVPKCPNGPRGQFNPIQPSINKYITY